MAKGYPVQTVNQDVLPQDWDKILQVEGYPLGVFNWTSGVSVPTGGTNTSIIGTTTPPTIGKIAYIDTATAVVDNIGLMQIAVNGDGAGRFPGFGAQFLASPNIPVTIPIKQLIRPYQFGNGSILMTCRNNLTAGSVTYRGSLSANCRVITDDTNFSADHVCLFAGDSTINGTGPTATYKMWPFIVRDFLLSQGYNCRVVLKSVSGSTSADHELWRQSGWHGAVLQRPSFGVYNLGINDSANATAVGTYLANVQAYWTWWSKAFPNAPLIIMGPTPHENDTVEALSVTYRSTVAAWVASVGSARLKFADPTALWDRKVASNYAASDTAGNRVHYTDGPNAAVAVLLQSVITANNLWPAR